MDLRFWRRREARTADLSGFGVPPPRIGNTYDGGSYSTDPLSALTGTGAVYACVSLLADVVGSLPLHLYRLADDRRERVRPGDGDRGSIGRGYPGSLARVLGELPNPEQTAVEFWGNVIGHQALWGTAYVEVIRDDAGRPKELWPLRPDKIEPRRNNAGERVYLYTLEDVGKSRRVVEIPYERVMRLPWFGTDGVTGVSPITVERLTVQGEQAAQRFSRNWFSNRAMPSSIVTIPPGPQDKFKDRAKVYQDQIEQLYGGTVNAGRVAVMEQGIDWKSVSMAFNDMQFVEQRQYTVAQIARLYRIPTVLLGITEKQTSYGTGVDSMGLFFLTYTLGPKLAAIEAAVSHDLGLVPGEKLLSDEGLYAEFQTAAVLKADVKGRYEAYGLAIANRIMSPAYVAQLENLPYDAERPSDYENPNTTAPDAEPADEPAPVLQAAASPVEPESRREDEDARTDALLAAVSNMTQMHAADMQMLSTVKRAEVIGQPDVHVTVPEAIVQLPSDLVIPTPEVRIDTQPFADSLRFLAGKLGEMDARAEARDVQLREALEHKPTKRIVIRDDHSNIIEIREVPEEETA